jgi:hypothetical protein
MTEMLGNLVVAALLGLGTAGALPVLGGFAFLGLDDKKAETETAPENPELKDFEEVWNCKEKETKLKHI